MKNSKENKNTPPIAEVINLIDWAQTKLGLSETQIEESLLLVSGRLSFDRKAALVADHGDNGYKMQTFISAVADVINPDLKNQGFITKLISNLRNLKAIRKAAKNENQKEIVNHVIHTVAADLEEIKKLQQVVNSLFLKARHTAVAKTLSVTIPPRIAILSSELEADSNFNLGLFAITLIVFLSAVGLEQILLKKDLETAYTEGMVIEEFFEDSRFPHLGTTLEISLMIGASLPYFSSAFLAYRSGSTEFTSVALSMLLISHAIAIVNNLYGNLRVKRES